MAHRAGNYIPQTRIYMPHQVFSHNSLNNLLGFFEPKDIEEKLALIEVYLLVNDFNSVEALIEQVYDDIKHIDQFVVEVDSLPQQQQHQTTKDHGADETKDGQTGGEVIPPLNPTHSNSTSSSKSEISRIPINGTKAELEERVYALRTMLKTNSMLVRTLKNSAYHGNEAPLVKPDPLPTPEERAAAKKLKLLNRGK